MRVDRKPAPRAPGQLDRRRGARGNTVAGARRMVSSEQWHMARGWAVVAFGLACSVTAVSAQDGRWERLTAAGVQAFEQGNYDEAARQLQAALPLADVGSLVPSLMNLAAVYYAQGHYIDAASLYQ